MRLVGYRWDKNLFYRVVNDVQLFIREEAAAIEYLGIILA
jgi:hypothetical protein